MTIPVIDQYGLDAVVDAYAKGAHVNCAPLAWMDFQSEPIPVWPGEYTITAGGVAWQGLGKAGFLIDIEALEAASTLEAAQFNIKISGVDSGILASAAGSNRSDYINQLLIVYALFCDEDWQPLANPMAVAGGFMGAMSIARTLNDGVWERTINLPVNNMFYGRGIAPASFWTDSDQQQRYPSAGDTGLTFIKQLQDYSIRIPWS